MTQVKPRTEPARAEGEGVVVRRPRACDAIGGALRHAFIPDQAMPVELMRSLNAIDAGR